MKASTMAMVTVSMIFGLAGCFLATHDPALHRGTVTTTRAAELDGGRSDLMRVPSAVEMNDLSQDAR